MVTPDFSDICWATYSTIQTPHMGRHKSLALAQYIPNVRYSMPATPRKGRRLRKGVLLASPHQHWSWMLVNYTGMYRPVQGMQGHDEGGEEAGGRHSG